MDYFGGHLQEVPDYAFNSRGDPWGHKTGDHAPWVLERRQPSALDLGYTIHVQMVGDRVKTSIFDTKGQLVETVGGAPMDAEATDAAPPGEKRVA